MLQLKVGPQGIRGKVNQGLDLDRFIDIVAAFATWLEDGPVVVARDTRPSSPLLNHAARAALCAAGREVLDAGICPTATAQGEAQLLGAAGMLSITASHNDASWNGLKLFGSCGRVLTSAEGREILDTWHQGEFARAAFDKLGPARDLNDVMDRYVERVMTRVDVDLIRSAGLRVVVDCCNGAGAMVVPQLCRALGIELIPLSCEASGRFPHPPDPSVTNMAQTAAIVAPVGAHAGFGLSSDCERLSMVTEQGQALGTGATLPLVINEVLARGSDSKETDSQGPATVVASAAADSRVEQIARLHGARVVRCGVGLQAVAQTMEIEAAVLGGEWSGGVAQAVAPVAFDGLLAMARLLQGVARIGAQAMVEVLPPVYTRTAEVPCAMSRAYSAVASVRQRAKGEITDCDGVRVRSGSDRYYIRVSHTEPVVRIFCEAQSDQRAADLIHDLQQQVLAASQV